MITLVNCEWMQKIKMHMYDATGGWKDSIYDISI